MTVAARGTHDVWRRTIGWHPRHQGWRIAALFMVGSTCFALASLPAFAARIDPSAVGAVFFIGSIFFTSAGFGQFVQLINRDDAASSTRHRLFAIQPRNPLWWALLVQLAGTLMFNISTAAATNTTLSDQQVNRLVWGPDIYGSIAFLIASHLAWTVVCGRLWCVRRDDADWWAAALNYLGSILFMLSAIASLVLPTTGEVLNVAIVNTGTFGGAVCFFLGAYLSLPARISPEPDDAAGRQPRGG